ncbi:MAG TPA: GDSL-type esterase/lipase family protein [Chryseosolibacter sp.]|nr:GDSL-type esterase/lipase family protein [Chryseosolibacter sp.]
MRHIALVLLLIITLVSQAQQKIKVACIGNSITEGTSIDSVQRYPAQLQRLLGDGYEVKNFGISGRTLLKKGDHPYWQEEKYQIALAWQPDIVIIKLGTNDSKPQNWIYADEFETDFKDLIHSFKDLPGKHRIFLCTPIPVFRESWGISARIVEEEIVPLIEKIARAERVGLIDLYRAIRQKPELAPDGVHPNADGAGVIAQEIFKIVR